MTQITIELNENIAKQFKQEAANRGLPVEELASRIISSATSQSSQSSQSSQNSIKNKDDWLRLLDEFS